MTTAPLPELIFSRAALAGITPSSNEVDQLIAYYTLLERWNQKINLTALPLAAREAATIDRLLIEPLIAAAQVGDSKLKWFDFGSGGGSPAIPLKLMRHRAGLVMIEAKERKSAFLREAVSTLCLQDATVSTARIEEVVTPALAGTADLVTIRAVRPDAEVLGAAHDLLKVHGQLLLFRGVDAERPEPMGFTFEGDKDLLPSSGILSTFRRSNG